MLGVGGGRGFIYNPDRNFLTRCSCGLGLMTNNHVELYGLLLGLSLDKDMQVLNIMILGDSLIMNQHLQKYSWPKENDLNIFLQRVSRIMDEVPQSFFTMSSDIITLKWIGNPIILVFSNMGKHIIMELRSGKEYLDPFLHLSKHIS